MNNSDPRMAEIRERLVQARSLADNSKWSELAPLLADVRMRLQDLGARSAYVFWLSSVAADFLDSREEAVTHIESSLALDPFNPEGLQSRQIIFKKLRADLRAIDPDTADPNSARIYDLLLLHNEVDVESHGLAIRFHMANADLDRAAALACAVTVLHPSWPPGWRLRAAVARRQGAEDEACRIEQEGATRAPDPKETAAAGYVPTILLD